MAARSSLARTESRWGLYHDRSRPPRARRRELALPPEPAQGRRRSDGVPEAAGGAVPRAGARAGRDSHRRQRPRSRWSSPHSSADRPRRPTGRGSVTRCPRSRPHRASPPCLRSNRHRGGSFGVPGRPGRRCAAHRGRRAHRAPPRRVRAALLAALADADAGVRARRRRGRPRTRRGAPGSRCRSAIPGLRRSRGARSRRLPAQFPPGRRRRPSSVQAGRPRPSGPHRSRTRAGVRRRRGRRERRPADDNREVRIAVANALGTLGDGASTVRALITDPDPLVRAAALAALGTGGLSRRIWPRSSAPLRNRRGRSGRVPSAPWQVSARPPPSGHDTRARRSAPRRAQGGRAEPDALGAFGRCRSRRSEPGAR